MEEQVKAAIENIRSSLHGDVEFVSIDDEGNVSVRLIGVCSHCPNSHITLKMGIENYLKREVPQVKSVISVQ